MKKIFLTFTLTASFFIAGCESEPGSSVQSSITPADSVTTFSGFDPANAKIPFPNNLLFKDTLDGTLNIPLTGGAADALSMQLNVLDGFSTSAPITTQPFTSTLDPASLASAVRVFEVTLNTAVSPIGGPVQSITAELQAGSDYVATLDGTGTVIVISPLKPLKPKTSYYVVITSDLRDAAGNPVGPANAYLFSKGPNSLIDGSGKSTNPSLTDAEAQALEPLRVINNLSETAVIAASNLKAANIIMSWSFTTQSEGDVLSVVRSLVNPPATAPASSLSASTVDLDGPGPLPQGLTPGAAAQMFEGTLDVPYYLTVSSTVSSPSNDPTALGSTWKAANAAFPGDTEMNLTNLNPLPAATNPALSIPLLVTMPTAGAKPYPVVIFQHGITTDRTKMLAVADTLAAAGFATVAIDMPMHGVDTTSPFYQAGKERTFDLDLVTEDANGNVTASVPDGTIDSSGRHFINLTNLVNTRDNLRQAVADLFALTAAISAMDVDGANGADDLDASNIHFLGHSLGAMVGTPFTALETNVDDVVMAFGGGGLPKILDGSFSFGPTISAGLAANGIVKGTADYESFLAVAQAVVDSGDPINYGATAAANHNVLFFEIAGGAGSPSDLVVPNTVPDANDTTGTVPAPLAGTEPLVGPAIMNLTPTNTSGSSGDLLVRFNAGHHGSLLTPTNASGNSNVTGSAEVFAEIQAEIASYLGSGTATLSITDGSVVAVP